MQVVLLSFHWSVLVQQIRNLSISFYFPIAQPMILFARPLILIRFSQFLPMLPDLPNVSRPGVVGPSAALPADASGHRPPRGAALAAVHRVLRALQMAARKICCWRSCVDLVVISPFFCCATKCKTHAKKEKYVYTNIFNIYIYIQRISLSC